MTVVTMAPPELDLLLRSLDSIVSSLPVLTETTVETKSSCLGMSGTPSPAIAEMLFIAIINSAHTIFVSLQPQEQWKSCEEGLAVKAEVDVRWL
jgi:hypothetical protein